MESFDFLLVLAIILISTKLLGLFSRRISMPAVVGALVAGVVLGPCVLDWISLDGGTGSYIKVSAEIGVIFLMFSAGLETDLKELNENKKASLVTAVIGVIVPLLGGALAYALYFHTGFDTFEESLKAVFIGVVLTATSVSITVETLRELGKLKGRVGTTILGAAIIDDILGIIVLSVATSLNDSSVKVSIVLIKILLYFVMIAALAFLAFKLGKYIDNEGKKRRVSIIAIAFCFFLSYVSEKYFGIADITGAYFAGLMLSTMRAGSYICKRIEYPSYLFFSPIFFASVGLQTTIDGMNSNLLIFTIILTIIALLSKVLGCGIGSKICGASNRESLLIGVGMISRGEVALIIAQKGYQVGLLDNKLFAPIIIVVIISTLITPILLKLLYKKFDKDAPAVVETSTATN